MSGTNFGLNDSLEYTEFEFDSADAQQAYDQTYSTSNWPLFQLGKPLTNVAAIKVLECQIPFSYYVFNSTNNTFTLEESEGGGDATVTILPGNYDSLSILSALANALTTASPNTHTYTVTFNNLTQKLTVQNNAGGVEVFSLIFNSFQFSPAVSLGFNIGFNISDTSQNLIAPHVVQLTGPNYIYLCSRSLGGLIHLYLPGNGEVNTSGSGADGPQIAKIPITSQPLGVTFWQDPVPLMWFDTGNTTFGGNLDFYCTLGTSDFQHPIDFNGNSFSFKLGILSNVSSHNDWLGGGKQNDRVNQAISGVRRKR